MSSLQCAAITGKGTKCTRKIKEESIYCWQHKNNTSQNIQIKIKTEKSESIEPKKVIELKTFEKSELEQMEKDTLIRILSIIDAFYYTVLFHKSSDPTKNELIKTIINSQWLIKVMNGEDYYGKIQKNITVGKLVDIMADAFIKYEKDYKDHEGPEESMNLFETLDYWFEHDPNLKNRFNYIKSEDEFDDFVEKVKIRITELSKAL
jgi:uncharacterized protein involved in tolerance to divalent cations